MPPWLDPTVPVQSDGAPRPRRPSDTLPALCPADTPDTLAVSDRPRASTDPTARSRNALTTCRPLAHSAGKSHRSDTPTTRGPRPRLKSTSVPPGKRLTMASPGGARTAGAGMSRGKKKGLPLGSPRGPGAGAWP